jgi:hypothetical protein
MRLGFDSRRAQKSGFARGRGIDTPNLHFDGGLAQMVERSLSISGVIAQR